MITLGVLCGDKCLDQSISALGVEGESVTQRSQFRTFLDKRLLQAVSSCMEVLLKERKQESENDGLSTGNTGNKGTRALNPDKVSQVINKTEPLVKIRNNGKQKKLCRKCRNQKTSSRNRDVNQPLSSCVNIRMCECVGLHLP